MFDVSPFFLVKIPMFILFTGLIWFIPIFSWCVHWSGMLNSIQTPCFLRSGSWLQDLLEVAWVPMEKPSKSAVPKACSGTKTGGYDKNGVTPQWIVYVNGL